MSFSYVSYTFTYINNSFYIQKRGKKLFYMYYQRKLPLNLTQLLQLWDFIGLPHEQCKQVFGDVLLIIGFEINSNLMRVHMSRVQALA